MARLQMATATAGATLTGGRLPEWTNGTVSKTVVVFRITMGSNPIPSATTHCSTQIPVQTHTHCGCKQEYGPIVVCNRNLLDLEMAQRQPEDGSALSIR